MSVTKATAATNQARWTRGGPRGRARRRGLAGTAVAPVVGGHGVRRLVLSGRSGSPCHVTSLSTAVTAHEWPEGHVVRGSGHEWLPSPGRHRVAVLARHGLLPFELGIPHRIFGRSRDARGRPLYEVVTCSVRPPGPVRTDADFTVHVEHGPEALAEADTVIVPGVARARTSLRRGPSRPRSWPPPSPASGPARGSPPSAPAPSCWPPPAARRPPGDHALGLLPSASSGSSRRSRSTRTCSTSTTATS